MSTLYVMWRHDSGVNNFILKVLDLQLLCPIRSHGWDSSGFLWFLCSPSQKVLFFKLSPHGVLDDHSRLLRLLSCFPAKSIKNNCTCSLYISEEVTQADWGFWSSGQTFCSYCGFLLSSFVLLITKSTFKKNVHVYSQHSNCPPMSENMKAV